MNRQRYEPVPQRPRDEAIILDNIHQHSSPYNYNSGLPNSIPSSRAPSILAPSIPASPPPSFHTHSTPGTPRPTPSTSTQQSYVAQDLWGVAPSTTEGDDATETGMGIGTSNDALATIKSLKQRVEWLEESIGRLLLEKESATSSGESRNRDNCCVTFTDASPDLERLLTTGRGSNCCVTFQSHNVDSKKERRHVIIAGLTALFLVCVMVTVIMSSIKGVKVGPAAALGLGREMER